jgi:hypothetical protein
MPNVPASPRATLSPKWTPIRWESIDHSDFSTGDPSARVRVTVAFEVGMPTPVSASQTEHMKCSESSSSTDTRRVRVPVTSQKRWGRANERAKRSRPSATVWTCCMPSVCVGTYTCEGRSSRTAGFRDTWRV